MKNNKILSHYFAAYFTAYLTVTATLAVLLCSCQHKNAKSEYQGLGASSVSADTIAQYAAKPLAQNLSHKIQNYLDLRPPGAGMLTPDGKQMFFTWKISGSQQVWRMDGPNTFPHQMTGGDQQTVLNAITADGKLLVLSRDENGEENPGLYLQSVEGGPLEKIQHIPKIQTLFGGLSRDGRSLYFLANDIDPHSYAIYRYSFANKTKELIFSEPGTWHIMDVADDGRLLLGKYFSNVRNQVYLLSTDQKLSPLFGQEEESIYEVAFTRKKDEYFVSTPRQNDFKVLYLFKGKDWQRLSPDIRADVTDFKVDERINHIFYQINDGGHMRLIVIDASTFKEILVPAPLDADQVRLAWISKAGGTATLNIEDGTGPSKSYAWSLARQKLVAWNFPATPEINTRQFAKVKIESYPARDGTLIPMLVRRPASCPAGEEAKCPVIVSFHGGPEGQAMPGFNVAAQLYVEAGYIYVEPNVRGSDGYGQAWINADNGPRRLQVITDIADAATYIRTKWSCKKVGVTGGSYGGYSTLYAMTKFAGSYDAGVEIVGMSNLVSFLQNTAAYRRALRAAEYGDPLKDHDALVKLSPITYLDQIQAPLLMIQGVNDPRVPVGEALQINEALGKKSIPHELILFADEGHGASKRSNQVIQLGKAIEFFDTHLK